MQVHGPGKVWRQRAREGVMVARCAVERLMRRMAGFLGVRHQAFHASATQSAGWMWAKRLLRLPASASGGFTSPWKMTMRAPAGTKGGFQ